MVVSASRFLLENGLFLSSPGTGKNIVPRPWTAAIQRGYFVICREAHLPR